MGATVLDRAEIGEHAIVGAQSLVPVGMKIPPHSLALGVPAKVIREVTPEEIENTRLGMERYLDISKTYREFFRRNPKAGTS